MGRRPGLQQTWLAEDPAAAKGLGSQKIKRSLEVQVDELGYAAHAYDISALIFKLVFIFMFIFISAFIMTSEEASNRKAAHDSVVCPMRSMHMSLVQHIL
jgi:hypothetical protein